MVVKGSVTVDGEILSDRDAIGLWDIDKVSIKAGSQDAEVLVMDVPMGFSVN
jgi:hypothetical protein